MTLSIPATLVATMFVLSLTLAGAQARAPTRSLCAASTAGGVVRAYYRALNQHRAAAAKACLTAHFLNSERKAVDPDWTNVTSARVVSLSPHAVSDATLPDVKPAPHRAVQILAQVRMRYRVVEGSLNGLNTWFIYVIKQHSTSPWRIAGIGSGP